MRCIGASRRHHHAVFMLLLACVANWIQEVEPPPLMKYWIYTDLCLLRWRTNDLVNTLLVYTIHRGVLAMWVCVTDVYKSCWHDKVGTGSWKLRWWSQYVSISVHASKTLKLLASSLPWRVGRLRQQHPHIAYIGLIADNYIFAALHLMLGKREDTLTFPSQLIKRNLSLI